MCMAPGRTLWENSITSVTFLLKTYDQDQLLKEHQSQTKILRDHLLNNRCVISKTGITKKSRGTRKSCSILKETKNPYQLNAHVILNWTLLHHWDNWWKLNEEWGWDGSNASMLISSGWLHCGYVGECIHLQEKEHDISNLLWYRKSSLDSICSFESFIFFEKKLHATKVWNF
jgi:hypothetical protein